MVSRAFKRAFQIFDLRINVEEIGVSQFPNIAETLLRFLRSIWATRDCQRVATIPAMMGEEKQECNDDAGLVSTNELRGSIVKGVLVRPDRQTFEMAANIFGKLFDRGIAALRFLAQRHQDDVIEIALEGFLIS